MPSVASKHKLVLVAFCSQYLRHVFVGYYPIVHVVTHHVWVIKILVAHLHPDAYWLFGAIGNKMLMKLPGTMWCFRIIGPLLVYISAGIGEHTMVPCRVVPCHNQSTGAA